MSWSLIPKPGTEYGPCEGKCDHIDCAQNRMWAESVCPHCKEPVGYDRPMILVDPDGDDMPDEPWHFWCRVEYHEQQA